MYYVGIFNTELVHEEDAFEYAKDHLDRLDAKDRADFVEWYFSGNWVKKSEEELEDEQRVKYLEEYSPNYLNPYH